MVTGNRETLSSIKQALLLRLMNKPCCKLPLTTAGYCYQGSKHYQLITLFVGRNWCRGSIGCGVSNQSWLGSLRGSLSELAPIATLALYRQCWPDMYNFDITPYTSLQISDDPERMLFFFKCHCIFNNRKSCTNTLSVRLPYRLFNSMSE